MGVIVESYDPLNWKNSPNLDTPLMDSNLNHMDQEGIQKNREYIAQLSEEVENFIEDFSFLKNLRRAEGETV